MSYDSIATKPAFNSTLVEMVQNLPDGAGILELGSGYTTRLIVDNMKPSHRFIALEESETWYKDIMEKDARMGYYVRYSPLVFHNLGRKPFYSDIVQNDLPTDVRFSLVIADGPTGGHRWPGTLLIWPYLANEYTILFDDTERQQYKDGIRLWASSNFATQEEADRAVQWFDGWAILSGKK